MYILSTNISFDAAHFLKDYNGKCGNIHGHRWKVVVDAGFTELKEDKQERGMGMDFSLLKDDLKVITDGFDHQFIIEKGSLSKELFGMLIKEGFNIVELPFRPTAENFAKYFYDELNKKNYDIISVSVYETPNNMAKYSGEKNECL